MTDKKRNPGQTVFGLDIGTRSVVGTVGYKSGGVFHVAAQYVKEHETRAMMDGQIHDIDKVANTVLEVKQELEKQLNTELHEVCIAAAGRVLKTVTASARMDFAEDTVIDDENIYSLEMLGIENAYEEFSRQNQSDVKFYCVGYTVVKYYLNGYPMTTIQKHKAKNISVDLIATFLPDEVIDGLYKAVQFAGLEVANLTLEPIAAMQAAVPVMFRMLNIALVDVGAGTSDISVTKDGSIIAYGMIPSAGDEFTDAIAQQYLVDFNEAEKIKKASGKSAAIKYKDILGNRYQVKPAEVLSVVEEQMNITVKEIADKIKELNGDKPVSAVFVVGGGGKIKGFTDHLAKEMGISNERVALRGSEVLKEIDCQFEKVKKDSLYVTPIGICLNFYDQSNNFIFVTFNDKRIKLYDNGHLTVTDAAIQFGFPNEDLFPKRGKELHYTVDGKRHMVRGQLGEAAVITVNDETVNLNSLIKAGDKIIVTPSTPGEAATIDMNRIAEFGSTITAVVNDQKVTLPKFAKVNGSLQSEFYSIVDGDSIEICNYYTVGQIAEFMDVILKPDMNIYVNNKRADLNTEVYDNFAVIWTLEELSLSDVEHDETADTAEKAAEEATAQVETSAVKEEAVTASVSEDDELKQVEDAMESLEIPVIVNSQLVRMHGKRNPIFVDVFDYIDFDLSTPHGKGVVTLLNGEKAQFDAALKAGDRLDIYWEQ